MSNNTLSGLAATPADLRQIVLSYLCDNCYADTAQVFARDSSTRELDKDGDEVLACGDNVGALDSQLLRQVESRKEIRMRILSGQINEAIQMLKRYFPAVLELSGYNPDDTRYVPAHLFLNLRIQNFIEQSRTMPLPWPSDILHSSKASTQQSSPASKFSLLADVTSNEEEERKNRLLTLMHELYVLTHSLASPMDRATYLTELSNVGGLLAYPIPENSREMRGYLGMSRRESVAEQINQALLYKNDVTLPSVVELTARHTALLFSTLSNLDRRLPPPELRPAGVEILFPENTSRSREAKSAKAVKERSAQAQTFPKFDLQNFLGAESP